MVSRLWTKAKVFIDDRGSLKPSLATFKRYPPILVYDLSKVSECFLHNEEDYNVNLEL
jgi:hypothetical protein